MVKKKLLISTISLLGAIAVASAVGVGYVINAKSNRYNAYTSAPTSSSNTDLIQSYFSAAVNGTRLEYLASYSHTAPLTTALNITKQENEAQYKYLGRTGYILIDDKYGALATNDDGSLKGLSSQPIWSTNVAAAEFRADLGSFITGVAVGELLNENQDYFEATSDGKFTWATYGGSAYDSVLSFMGGMQKGIQWFNENIVPKKTGYKELKQVFINSGVTSNFAFSFDPTGANSLITQFLTYNLSMLFPVAGPQIAQAARLIKQSDKKTILIGVDSAVEEDDTINLTLPKLNSNQTVGNNKIVQFSSVKNINVVADKITQAINDPSILKENQNNSEWQNIGGLGYSSLGDVLNNGVGVSDQGKEYFVKAMQIFDSSITISGDTTTEEEYLNAAKLLANQSSFKALDNDSEKIYRYYNTNGVEGNFTGLANNGKYTISNTSFQMIPIASKSETTIKQWYEEYYKDNTNMLNLESQNISTIMSWIKDNEKTIDQRAQLATEFEGLFVKENYEKNNSLIKILFQSPTNVLFDNSFLESCYMGLISYWKRQGVILPSKK